MIIALGGTFLNFFKCLGFLAGAIFAFSVSVVCAHPQTSAPLENRAYTDTAEAPITYCIDPLWTPYEAIRNGSHVGISADYMQIVSELTGLTFQLVPTESWQQSLEYVQAGKCQMISMLNVSDYRKQFLDFSIPYFAAPNILVAREGTPILQGYAGIGNRLVGIVKGYRQIEYIRRYYPDLRLKLIRSEREGLAQLARGEFDVMVGSLLSVNTHLNNQQITNLNIVGYAEPFDSLSFGVKKSFSHIIPILNDAINQIPESKRVEIYRQWNNVKVRYHRDYFKLTVTLLFIIFVILTLVWRHRTLNTHSRLMGQKNAEIESLQTSLLDRNRTLEFLSAHDTLTGLYNRNHMIQKSEEEIYRFRRFHTVPCMIMVELYHGIDPRLENHETHRKHYLKALASVCLATVREVDVVSRYTEGQIVVLCPQTNIDEGQILAERLLSAIDKNNELIEMHMVASIGLAELKEGENFSDWIERTTKALYQAKRQGTTRVAVAD